jgi:hypothetical protein
MAQQIPIDPNVGLTDLAKQLGGDAKQLLKDELRLAKLEMTESMHRAGHGALWLGVTVVGLVAATLFLVTVIGRVASGHYWIGAMVTAAVELALGFWLVKRGLVAYKAAPVTLPETRSGLRVLPSGGAPAGSH